MNGSLEKLKILAYSDANYLEPTGESFTTQYNPEEFSESVNIQYDSAQAPGTTGSQLKFNKINPQKLKLNFLLDGTGVSAKSGLPFGITIPLGKTTNNVIDQVDQFKLVCLDMKGDIHTPRYLKISWGSLLFKGKLTNLQITYTLFKPDGTPIRAKLATSFESCITDQTRRAMEQKSSPDLTHIREVQEGDTLPLMCYRIYKDSTLYLFVAKANGLDQFRSLKPGQKLYFPPLEQESPSNG